MRGPTWAHMHPIWAYIWVRMGSHGGNKFRLRYLQEMMILLFCTNHQVMCHHCFKLGLPLSQRRKSTGDGQENSRRAETGCRAREANDKTAGRHCGAGTWRDGKEGRTQGKPSCAWPRPRPWQRQRQRQREALTLTVTNSVSIRESE